MSSTVRREVVVDDSLRMRVEVLDDHTKVKARFSNAWLAEHETPNEDITDRCARMIQELFPEELLPLIPDEVWIRVLDLKEGTTETVVHAALIYYLPEGSA